MQNEQSAITCVTASGKKITGTCMNTDAIIINPNAPKLSVEYARCRTAINADFNENFRRNQAMAKRLRKEHKDAVIQALGGKVSISKDEQTGKKKWLVTFPDHTVANL